MAPATVSRYHVFVAAIPAIMEGGLRIVLQFQPAFIWLAGALALQSCWSQKCWTVSLCFDTLRVVSRAKARLE